MEIGFTKNDNAQHSIAYKRDDGSITWMHASAYFIRHDLSHYAIETSLFYATAFLGMINSGMQIGDFEDRQKRLSMQVSDQAWYAECMANLFLMELSEGELPDFNQTAAAAFAEMGLPIQPPSLTNEEQATIRTCLRQLLDRWEALPDKEKMILTF